MTDRQTYFEWPDTLGSTYQAVVQDLVVRLPVFIGAFATLLIGLLVAYLLRILVRRLASGIQSLLPRETGAGDMPAREARYFPVFIGNVVFWSVALFFLAASVNLLGWNLLVDFLGSLLAYLPNLVSGLIIILAGLAFGKFVGGMSRGAAETAGFARPEIPGRFAQVTVVIFALVIGIEQLGIGIGFLTTSFVVIGGVLLFGVSLAFGLGARDFVANLIGAQDCRRHYRVGDWIKLDDDLGQLLEITQTAMVLDTEQGRRIVPARLLQQRASEIVADEHIGDKSVLEKLFQKKGPNRESP